MPPRYELDCYVVMANHAHVIVRPLAGDVYHLRTLSSSWKQYSAKQINRSLERTAALWLEEAFDVSLGTKNICGVRYSTSATIHGTLAYRVNHALCG